MSSQVVIRNRNKKKQKKDGGNSSSTDPPVPTKQEKEVAKYLRFNMKTKEGICMGNQVQYFAGCKAVDMLMASKWASATKKDDSVLFPNRKACVEYCQNLLEKDIFRRVFRLRSHRNHKHDRDDSCEKKPAEKSSESKKDRKKKKDDKVGETVTTEETSTTATTKVATTTESDDKEKEKKPKKPRKPARLEPHEEQVFVDGSEKDDATFVWIFDPTPLKTYVLGTLVIIGAIAACLYPLWPMQLRIGIYYVCLGLIGLLGLLIALAIVRFFLFAGVWAATLGKKHLWLFPNLFEDVGFFDSFKPVYVLSSPSADNNNNKSKKKVVDKDDKKEEEEEQEQRNKSKKSAAEEKEEEAAAETKKESNNEKDGESERVLVSDDGVGASGTDVQGGESAGEQSSSGSAVNGDFEMVQHSDLDHDSSARKHHHNKTTEEESSEDEEEEEDYEVEQ